MRFSFFLSTLAIVSFTLAAPLSRRTTWLEQCQETIASINSEVDDLDIDGQVSVWLKASPFIFKVQDLLERHHILFEPSDSWQLSYADAVDQASQITDLTPNEEAKLRQLDMDVRKEIQTQIWGWMTGDFVPPAPTLLPACHSSVGAAEHEVRPCRPLDPSLK